MKLAETSDFTPFSGLLMFGMCLLACKNYSLRIVCAYRNNYLLSRETLGGYVELWFVSQFFSVGNIINLDDFV